MEDQGLIPPPGEALLTSCHIDQGLVELVPPGEGWCGGMLEAAAVALEEAPFRGGAVEYLEGAPMGKGHGNAGQPFDIETACYLKPVFAAYDEARKNGRRLKLVLLAGVKTVKSFTGEVCAAEHVCTASGDAAIFFGTEVTAEVGATTRILDFFKGTSQGGGIPRFRTKMETITSRFDDTMGALKFPDKTLFILAANLANTQQKNLAFVLLQDAFLTATSGMIREMIARTTQYQKEAVIILESQGGEKGFDFDEQYLDTNQQELHVTCPDCGKSHVFNWKVYDEESMTRTETFVAALSTEELKIKNEEGPEAEAAIQAMIAEKSARLKGKVAGFQRGEEELIKTGADGQPSPSGYNEAAVLRETHFECFHCGGVWRDDGEFGALRIGLDRSSHYMAARGDALPGNIGFNIPQWINRRLPWGPMMLEKLQVQRIARVTGNYTPLKQWWQKTAARSWDGGILKERRKRNQNSYDVGMARHDAWRLCMIVDNQQDLMLQWVMVLAAKQDGSVRQLWRGPLMGLTEVRKKQLEYVDDQKRLLLKDQFVFFDGRYRPQEICRHLVEHQYGHWATIDGERVWLTWNMMQGSKYESFTHADERDKTKRFMVGDVTWREFQVGGNYVEVICYPFSATGTGQRFEADRDGNGVETLFLDRQPDEPADDNPLSHHSMIYSNKLVAAKTTQDPRMSRLFYAPMPASAPDHYFHMWRMWEAVKEIWKIDGVVSGKG